MKKSFIIFLFLPFLGLHTAHAATGSAQDGILFSIVIVGVLVCIAVLLFSIDFLKKNGKKILFRVLTFFRRKIRTEEPKDQYSAELI